MLTSARIKPVHIQEDSTCCCVIKVAVLFFVVIEAAVSEWEETSTKEETEENIYAVKTEPVDGEEAFEVIS